MREDRNVMAILLRSAASFVDNHDMHKKQPVPFFHKDPGILPLGDACCYWWKMFFNSLKKNKNAIVIDGVDTSWIHWVTRSCPALYRDIQQDIHRNGDLLRQGADGCVYNCLSCEKLSKC